MLTKSVENCPLKVRGYEFPTDLMLLPFDELEIILGMDWLTVHDAVVNCKQKQIMLRRSNGELVMIKMERSYCTSNLISVLTYQKLFHKGAEAFLAYVLNTTISEPKIIQVQIV